MINKSEISDRRFISLYDALGDRSNNLNIIRFIAAIMVVFAHSYALAADEKDLLNRIVHGQLSFGSLAVCIFFFFSGFLISKSVNGSLNAHDFFKRRIIRILPPLIFEVSFCAFVLGSLVTEMDVKAYFTDTQTYLYLTNAFFILRHNLPGVFEHNIYGSTVNGSLWTLPVEFICYIVCYIVYRLGFLKEEKLKYTIPFVVVAYVVGNIVLKRVPLLRSAIQPSVMFYMGMLYYIYRKRIHLDLERMLLCMIGLITSAFLDLLKYGCIIFLPYILLYFVFGTRRKLNNFGKRHELSYGIYLCAFPIQQTITMLFGGSMNSLLNFVLSTPIAILGGYVINILVEKPLENYYAKGIERRKIQ